MEELKKCPFCGGEAKTSFVFGRAGVVCAECDANIRMYLDASMEDAIKAWNNRKPVEDVLERLEELKMAEYDDSDEEPQFEDVEEWLDRRRSSGRLEAYENAINIIKSELRGGNDV